MKKNPSKSKIINRRVTFSLSATEAGEVFVAGDFNGWDPRKSPMKKTGNGKWQKVMMLPPGEYGYKFVVDGKWLTDPQNRELRPNPFGTFNSVLTVYPKKP